MIRYFAAMHGYLDAVLDTKEGLEHIKKEYGDEAIVWYEEGVRDAHLHHPLLRESSIDSPK